MSLEIMDMSLKLVKLPSFLHSSLKLIEFILKYKILFTDNGRDIIS